MRASAQGVKPGEAVVDARGMIGRIFLTGERTCLGHPADRSEQPYSGHHRSPVTSRRLWRATIRARRPSKSSRKARPKSRQSGHQFRRWRHVAGGPADRHLGGDARRFPRRALCRSRHSEDVRDSRLQTAAGSGPCAIAGRSAGDGCGTAPPAAPAPQPTETPPAQIAAQPAVRPAAKQPSQNLAKPGAAPTNGDAAGDNAPDATNE